VLPAQLVQRVQQEQGQLVQRVQLDLQEILVILVKEDLLDLQEM
jgi:hypothetical protein